MDNNLKDVFDLKEAIEDKVITQKEINEIDMEKILGSIKDSQLKKDFEMTYNDLFLKLNSGEKEINIETKLELKILKEVVDKAGINIAKQNSENNNNKEKGSKIVIDAYTPFEIEEGTPGYRNNNKTTGIQFSKTFDSSKLERAFKDFFN